MSVALATAAASTAKPKLWNSLEKAKVAISVFTPLLIAVLGIYFAHQQHEQDVERALREDLRGRRAAAEPFLASLEVDTQKIAELIRTRSDELRSLDGQNRHQLHEQTSFQVSEYLDKSRANFARLRFLIEDTDTYDQLYEAFYTNSATPLLGALSCTGDGAPTGMASEGCELRQMRRVYRCPTLILDAARHFDQLPLHMSAFTVDECQLPPTIGVRFTDEDQARMRALIKTPSGAAVGKPPSTAAH